MGAVKEGRIIIVDMSIEFWNEFYFGPQLFLSCCDMTVKLLTGLDDAPMRHLRLSLGQILWLFSVTTSVCEHLYCCAGFYVTVSWCSFSACPVLRFFQPQCE